MDAKYRRLVPLSGLPPDNVEASLEVVHLCPSCGGGRMTECAARLVEDVLSRVPVRQWGLSLPYRLAICWRGLATR